MRREGIPLYALESGDPVKEFDFIGFTLQYELSYTNVLNMLELAGIPLRRGRYLLAALLGGLYAAAGFLPGWGFLTQGPVKAAAGVLLALIQRVKEIRKGEVDDAKNY